MNKLNFINFQFKSEKQVYKIDFETTEISIFDIKRRIIELRNMTKYPEKFELLFYDQENKLLNKDQKDDNVKVQPHTKLTIKRVPNFLINPTFKDTLYDMKENNLLTSLSLNKEGENKRKDGSCFEVEDQERYSSLLEYINSPSIKQVLLQKDQKDQKEEESKILFSKDHIKNSFKCNHCYKIRLFNTNSNTINSYADIIMFCCGESICEKCIEPFKTKTKENPIHSSSSIQYERTNFKENTLSKCKICSNENVMYAYNTKAITMRHKLFYIANHIDNFIDFQPVKLNKDSNELYASTYYKQNLSLYESLLENSRFYIIKSSNIENIKTSQMHNEWATLVNNQKKINDGFQGKDYIILIFSANKSRSFQGFAILTSYVTDKIASYWNNENGVNLGGCFSIQWLVTCELSFQKATNLVNSLNNENVIKSRDLTELDKCLLCVEKEAEEIMTQNKTPHFSIEGSLSKLFDEIKRNKEREKDRNGRWKVGSSMSLSHGNGNGNGQFLRGGLFNVPTLSQLQNQISCIQQDGNLLKSFQSYVRKVLSNKEKENEKEKEIVVRERERERSRDK